MANLKMETNNGIFEEITSDMTRLSKYIFDTRLIDVPSDYDIFRTEALEEELELYREDNYGVRYSLDGKKVLKASKPLDGLDYTIKDGVLTICDSAFQSKGLHSITLPNYVVSIGGIAFANNDDMEYCNIPASVRYIADNNPWGGCFSIKKMECKSPLFQIIDGILYASDFRVCYGMIYWNSYNIEIDTLGQK